MFFLFSVIAFGVRNAEKSFPYKHNDTYKNLNERLSSTKKSRSFDRLLPLLQWFKLYQQNKSLPVKVPFPSSSTIVFLSIDNTQDCCTYIVQD